MTILTIITSINVIFGTFMFFLMCVDPNDSGPLGMLHRFVYKTIGAKLIFIIRKFFGQRGTFTVDSIKKYFEEGNHPIFQLLYLTMTIGGYVSFSIICVSRLMCNDKISMIHLCLFHIFAILAFWSYYNACKSDPGSITAENVKNQIEKYEEYYDGLIFKKNNQCKTCLLIKPARSKHCSICKICVPKCDHHCTWIRKCVGQKNYKHFLLFLLINAIWATYSTIIAFISVIQFLKIAQFTQEFLIGPDGTLSLLRIQILRVFLQKQPLLAFLLVLGSTGSLAFILVLMVHLWLINNNLTTNQRIKKNSFRHYFENQISINNMLKTKFTEGVGKVKYLDKIMTKTEVYDDGEQYKKRKDNLQKKIHNQPFLKKIIQIFRE